MRIAISNIAWQVEKDEEVTLLLKKHHIDAIDIAPGKYFSNLATARINEIQQLAKTWVSRGITLTGMQSLLFGTQGLNIFSTDQSRTDILTHLQHVFRIAQGLGSRFLVFGSPKNRDRGMLDDLKADQIATTFFTQAADLAQKYDVCLCLEANPERYGCNYMTNTLAAARLVKSIDHPCFRLHLDTGTMLINEEPITEIITQNADIIGHVHASQPDLAPLDSCTLSQEKVHREIAAILKRLRPDLIISIEMLNPNNDLALIDRALAKACSLYRTELSPS